MRGPVRRERGGRCESSAGSTPKIPDVLIDEPTPQKVLQSSGYGGFLREFEGDMRYVETLSENGLRNEVFRLRAENLNLRQHAEKSEVLMQRLQAEMHYLRLALESLQKSVTNSAVRSRGFPATLTLSPPAVAATNVAPTPSPPPVVATSNSTVDAAVQAAQAAAAAAEEIVKLSKSLPFQQQTKVVDCPVALLPTTLPTPILGSFFSALQPVPASLGLRAPETYTTGEPRHQQDVLDMLQRIEKLVQTNSLGAEAFWQKLQQSQPGAATQAPPPQASPLVTINATSLERSRILDAVEQREGAHYQPTHGHSLSHLGPSRGHGSIGSQDLGKVMDELAMVNNRLDSQARHSQARSMSVRSLVDKSALSASDTLGFASPTA